MKKIIVTSISLVALSAFNANVQADTIAGKHIYHSDQCEINLEGELRFADKALTVKTDAKDSIKITADYRVFINDQAQSLSDQETQWVKEYYDSIEQAIPQVMTVAAEGIQIANIAVTEVLRGFLGDESRVATQLETKLNDLHTQLKEHVYQNPDSLTFDTEALETDLAFGADFDAEVDQIVSDIMDNAMGEFLVQMGRSMLSGDGSAEPFEQRMERMGDEIEAKMEGKTDQIEVEAKKLCDMLTTIDASESKVQQIMGLSGVDIVTTNNNA